MKPHPTSFWLALFVLLAPLLQALPEARSADYVAVFGPVTVDTRSLRPPTITEQPVSQTAPLCGDAAFAVMATGTLPLSYQWRLNGSNLVGATNSSLFLSKVTAADAGDYMVAVSNGVGSADSVPATLTLAEPPTVRIVSPVDGSGYASGTNLPIDAAAEDAHGIVRKVEFYANALKLGERASAPYTVVWSNLSSGSYTLSARASGDCGLLSTSAPVRITVTRTNAWPTISAVADVTILEDADSPTIAFTVGDAETSADKLRVSATSSNDALIPTTDLRIVGAETNRILSLKLVPNRFGAANLQIAVGDEDGATNTTRFVVTVLPVNDAPSVTLVYPANNVTFISGTNLTLVAEATDPDGRVTRVEFLSGGSALGDDTLDPYSSVWQNVPAGIYVLSARATDDQGATATSSEVTITVRTTDPVPPTVVLTAPTNRTVFQERENISLTAAVTVGSDPIAKVEFYAGSVLLGETNAAPYTFVWESAPGGDYRLSARAIDRKGLTGESSPIRVAIGTCGRVAIVRGSAHPEVGALQGYLFELGLDHEVFERAALRVTPELRDRAAALGVLVWEETGGEALTEEDVLWLQSVVADGRSVYFIGDGLISAAAGLSEAMRQAWYGLLHLEPGIDPVGAQTVVIDHEAYQEITLTGYSGSVTNFACDPSASGSRMACLTGADAVLGRLGDNDVVVANEYLEHSGRSVTQLLRVHSGVDQRSIEERAKLFQNAVWWLMRCPACSTFNIGIRDDGIPDRMNLGEEFTYAFVVYQTGECGANGVRAVVDLPASLRFVRAGSQRGWWSYENGRVAFFAGRMSSAAQGRLEVTVVPMEPGRSQLGRR